MHILDTDTITHLHSGNLKVLEKLKKTDDYDIRISVITRIELLRGRFDFLLTVRDIF
jgi:tRNA(fMet)-specific endonuclease VapC